MKGNNENIICLTKNIQYSKNQASILNFEIPINSKYFNKLNKFKDYIQVLDLRTNEKIFDGRVISNNKAMNSSGEFSNIIQCESVLNYLNDAHVGKWDLCPFNVPAKSPKYAIGNFNTKKFIAKVLDKYNSIVNDEKKIFLGNIEVIEPVDIKTNYETCLNAIQSKICDSYKGYLIIRNVEGTNYLDFLKNSPVKEVVKIEVAKNMNSISINDSNVNIFTRIIPFGAKGLDITSVNNGCNYVQDNALVAEYGIIESVMNWNNITIAENLLDKAKAAFSEVSLIANQIQLTALDLSYINDDYDTLKLYTPVSAKNDVLNYNKTHEIVSINFDLYNPYLSSFDLNCNPTSLTDSMNSVSEQLNSNTLEIVSFGDELIDKVSNDEFESYKVQTANEISNKITGSQAKSIFNQTASEFDFTIGNTTPLKITSTGLEMDFENGSKCELNENGFTWDAAGSKYPYHCLAQSGTVFQVESNQEVTITLPDEFKGKNCEFTWWCGNVFPSNPQDLLFSANIEKVNFDIENAAFTLKADMMVRNPETENTPAWRGKLNIMWSAIA